MIGADAGATAARTREPWLERAVAAVLRTTLRATLLRTFRAGRPIPAQRTGLARVTALTLPPRGVRFTRAECGGIPGEFACDDAATSGPAILYLHGGAYCVGSARTHRAITGALARLTAAQVFAADYRLAPEHPCPAAVDDACAAYAGLLARGHAPDGLAIAGDSAGGGLTVATALRLRERGLPLPAALVTFSPWVDLGEPERGPVPAGEAMLSPAWVRECATSYLGGRDARDPWASPIHGELAGLPPTLTQVGTDEWLRPDAHRLHAALRHAGVDSTLQEYPRRWHVFQINAGVLADADRALGAVAAFLRERWRAAAGPVGG